ncbi:uncharacterized protein LOC130613698 [Hydractinia symbiolongicarpus]|uniref:uncharacterized protein LOC130613698 n=1 Tax=Hydractinia symbiolongicarpus TaxID=13093 RepID=UPI002550E373|nr:uncharacterized protein LOC130613698 [Hydractinia symbiolongicarpus]
MHLEERPMSGSITGAKPIFPLSLSGQTLMFSSSNCHSNRCDQGRSTIHSLPHNLNHSRCSCENFSPTQGFNRLLLPANSPNSEQVRVQTNLPGSISDSWLRIPSSRANYESLLLNGFPLYGKFSNESYPSLDYALLANARRKNATRETTSTLKAWLNEHKKNPYPTKGEKIMLAILTKMTLTQVSTWFANARRRLKKENKMTWSPRKKTGDKKGSSRDGDSCASDSDVECMDVDVDGVDINGQKECSVSIPSNEDSSSIEKELQRPSVIRALESPTFNEIRDRFKDDESPVQELQKWVNGCLKPSKEENNFADELTPPSTPIENKVSTFSAQKLFEAFDSSKQSNLNLMTCKEESYNREPLHLIFSSKPPVCSTKILPTEPQVINSLKDVPTGVMTPQPSPKTETEFLIKETKQNKNEPSPEVRVQGLTTSRELEAVLALTNLCKT